MRYWLLKTEPESYSIDDLRQDGKTFWDGVRNYQARNFIRDDMKVGDLALIYHSNADPLGAAGIAKVCRDAYPDFTAWDPQNPHFDPKSTEENPVWFMVDVEFAGKFRHHVTLAEMKSQPGLAEMMVCKPGTRLSVQPVEAEHFAMVKKLGKGFHT
ncbi:MAG: EVE domain-containing protein [Planctomycetota bacterium]